MLAPVCGAECSCACCVPDLLFAPILALASPCFLDIRVHVVATRAAVYAAPAVPPIARHQVALRIAALWMLTEDVPSIVEKRARSGAVVIIATMCRVVVLMVLVH